MWGINICKEYYLNFKNIKQLKFNLLPDFIVLFLAFRWMTNFNSFQLIQPIFLNLNKF